MARRNDTSLVGDLAEAEAIRLLADRGWTARNLNADVRNHRLYDLVAVRGGEKRMISVKHARANRQISLGKPTIFRDLKDGDFLIIFLPSRGRKETNIVAGDYDVWVVPGSARHVALNAHLHYYGGEPTVAWKQSRMMIKDKLDRPGGRSISGAAFKRWEDEYKDAWGLLDSPAAEMSP